MTIRPTRKPGNTSRILRKFAPVWFVPFVAPSVPIVAIAQIIPIIEDRPCRDSRRRPSFSGTLLDSPECVARSNAAAKYTLRWLIRLTPTRKPSRWFANRAYSPTLPFEDTSLPHRRLRAPPAMLLRRPRPKSTVFSLVSSVFSAVTALLLPSESRILSRAVSSCHRADNAT